MLAQSLRLQRVVDTVVNDVVVDHSASGDFAGDLARHVRRLGDEEFDVDVVLFLIGILVDRLIGGGGYHWDLVAAPVPITEVARPTLGLPLQDFFQVRKGWVCLPTRMNRETIFP
jgi:hypothetical protein